MAMEPPISNLSPLRGSWLVQGASGWIGGRSLRALRPRTSAAAASLDGDAGKEQPESEPSSERDMMGVSINRDPPKSSFLVGFSSVNHPFWGTTIYRTIVMGVSPKMDGLFHGNSDL